MIGTWVVWRWQGSKPNNPSTHHVRCFHCLEENWKYQMPVRTEDFDKAIAEVIGTFYGVEEIWEGIVNYYLKERHIGGFADRLWKITAVPVKVPGICREWKGISRQHKTFTSCQNAACSNEFFSPAGRLWLSKYAVCFILRGCDTLIDFLLFISGRHDLPSDSDASREHFLWPLLKRKLLHCGDVNFKVV